MPSFPSFTYSRKFNLTFASQICAYPLLTKLKFDDIVSQTLWSRKEIGDSSTKLVYSLSRSNSNHTAFNLLKVGICLLLFFVGEILKMS